MIKLTNGKGAKFFVNPTYIVLAEESNVQSNVHGKMTLLTMANQELVYVMETLQQLEMHIRDRQW